MANGLARYEFSERLADILGESRRDLRFRVTLMVAGGLFPPGPRGRGSPPATPQYAADLLIGVMAAPQQAQTVEAIRCYAGLCANAVTPDAHSPRVLFGPRTLLSEETGVPLSARMLDGMSFGEALANLLALAASEETRAIVAGELFGIWLSRGCPVAALQFSRWWQGGRAIVSHTYGLAADADPPAWLDPRREGRVEPGLSHAVFLPVRKLIEIGSLTTLSIDRRNPMLNKLSQKMASITKMAQLAAKTPHGNRWEKLLSTLANVQAWSEQVEAQETRLREVSGFGSNPGELRMLTYLPDGLPANASLVVVLHGCTQSAASYNKGSGWSTLADRYGFALLFPQQQWNNNPLRCFNWFRPEDNERQKGEPLSIRQMVDHMLTAHGLDPRRVYVNGTSSGGAMSAVMLATYPDVFAGGAVIAGVPYRSAKGLQEGLESIFVGRCRSAGEWGDLVRQASEHRGAWPKLSIWHGDADSAVKPVNAEEMIKQWTDVHALPLEPTVQTMVDGYPHRVWQNADGEEVLESYTITGMSHGAALDPGPGPEQCGTAAPFFNAVGISSTHRIAEFWGLMDQQPAASRPSAVSADNAQAEEARARADEATASLAADQSTDKGKATSGQVRADSTARQDSTSRATSGKPFGLDVHGIISASLEAAGLLKSGTTANRPASGVPLGIDVPGIISTALQAAGAVRGRSQRSGTQRSAAQLHTAGWEGSGWEMLINDPRAFRGGSLLHGCAISGEEGSIGPRAQAISRRIELGQHPELSYLRRLDLQAAVNDYTRASFRILVEGVVVDEVMAIGMTHQENEWLRQTAVDLSRFANQTVTLTLEVAAYSNLHTPVVARAWIDQIAIQNAVDLTPC